jgi:hypothetical protein
MAEVQAEALKLRKRLAVLESEERSLKAYLPGYYDTGTTEVTLANGKVLEVDYSVTERVILNQDKARAMLTRLGKRVPESLINVVSFKVKAK